MASKPKDTIITCKKDKLAILGSADTLQIAPFEDPEFELWGCAVVTTYPVFKRAELLFELHDASYWNNKNIIPRLNKYDGPTYMQNKEPLIPKSIAYPLDAMLEYRPYHTTTITYMLVLALHSFLTTGKPNHLAMYGVHMETGEEYGEQRPCCEYWLARMEQAGMEIYLPPGGAVLTSNGLYAFENYNPIVVKMRERVDGLKIGIKQREDERNAAEAKRQQQIGASLEAEHWLKQAQRGELNLKAHRGPVDPNLEKEIDKAEAMCAKAEKEGD